MNASTTNMAQKAKSAVGTSRTYPNRRDGKNKYSDGQEPFVRIRRKRRRNKERLIYNRCE